MRSGYVHLALVKGDIGDGQTVLTRVHSECLTGVQMTIRRHSQTAELVIGGLMVPWKMPNSR